MRVDQVLAGGHVLLIFGDALADFPKRDALGDFRVNAFGCDELSTTINGG